MNHPAVAGARKRADLLVEAARACPDRRLRRSLLIDAAKLDAQVRAVERVLRRARRRQLVAQVRPAVKVVACGVALLVLAGVSSLLPGWWLLAGIQGAAGSVFLTVGLVAPNGLLRD